MNLLFFHLFLYVYGAGLNDVMCSYASKVVHIAVHTLGFLICELKKIFAGECDFLMC